MVALLVLMMSLRAVVPIGLVGLSLIVMSSIFARDYEELVPEDGKIAAKALPFDQKQAEKAYETATFGMG